MLVSLIYRDQTVSAFGFAFAITFGLGLVLLLLTARSANELRTRDGFLIVTLFWTVLGTVGCLPFMFSPSLNLSFSDAVFESVSGLTTTGATILSGIDDLPKSILFYRQLLQWLGGMGIVVLAVAVLPMLGIGGMQLYRAEFPGPVKDNKLVPRLAETAKALWYIYVTLTIGCALAYWIAGMSGFDAIGHSFATIAIGGFSTHDQSIGYFNNPAIEVIAMVFMVIAGANFA
ncbi:MAG: potassium transporter TrkG, partial [Pseudohongiellaceae bacterium]